MHRAPGEGNRESVEDSGGVFGTGAQNLKESFHEAVKRECTRAPGCSGNPGFVSVSESATEERRIVNFGLTGGLGPLSWMFQNGEHPGLWWSEVTGKWSMEEECLASP